MYAATRIHIELHSPSINYNNLQSYRLMFRPVILIVCGNLYLYSHKSDINGEQFQAINFHLFQNNLMGLGSRFCGVP